MRRPSTRIVASALAALLAFALLQLANAELGGEVLVLETVNDDGSTKSSRLWVVDDGGSAWVRARSRDSVWLRNLEARPEIVMDRQGRRQKVRASVEPDAAARIDGLMHEAYGVNEKLRFSALLGQSGIPVRLDPVLSKQAEALRDEDEDEHDHDHEGHDHDHEEE